MNSRGNINFGFWILISGFWPTMQREQFQVAGFVKQFRRPAVLLRGGLEVAQHGADVYRLAVVAAVVFAEFLHADNLTQRRKDANRISPAAATE